MTPQNQPQPSPNPSRQPSPLPELDLVLAALRTAEPAAGFEARLLTRVQSAQAEARLHQQTAAHPLSWRNRAAWPVAATLALVLLLTFGAAHQPRHPESTHPAAGNSPAPKLAHAASAVPTPAQPLPAAAFPLSSQPQADDMRRDPQPTAHQPPEYQSAEPNAALSPAEALAYGETHAPSQAPPPLPTTPQETLLAQAAAGPDRGQLAILNPFVKSAQADEDAAEFAEFFAPETPPDQAPVALAANHKPQPQGEIR